MARPTPESIAKAGTEHAEQAALFCWAAEQVRCGQYPSLRHMFAIPNGGDRNKLVASRLKAEGVKKGVVDIFLPVPSKYRDPEHGPKHFHGLWLEMKKKGREKEKNGGCSDEQVTWLSDMRLAGYSAHVVYGWEHARHVILWYMNLDRPASYGILIDLPD